MLENIQVDRDYNKFSSMSLLKFSINIKYFSLKNNTYNYTTLSCNSDFNISNIVSDFVTEGLASIML